MRASLLIAGNFLRENRWAVILLVLWGIGSGTAGALTVASSSDDALFFLKQQAVYSVFFTVFLAASALYNQRKSRRILAVLSRGIERWQYLAGIVIGYGSVSVLYSLALGVTGAWTFSLAGVSPVRVLPLMIMLFLASLLAGTLALFFSTFLNPLFTLVCTSIALGSSAVLGKHVPALIPAYTLMQTVMDYSFSAASQPAWNAAVWALLEMVGLWLAAAWIFERRDIAVSVE